MYNRAIRTCAEISGVLQKNAEKRGKVRSFVEFCGVFMEKCGKVRKSAEICGNTQKYVEKCGNVPKSAEKCGNTLKYAAEL